MCNLICPDINEILNCPARRAVYLSEKSTHENIEFVDQKFLLDLDCCTRAPGVLIDGELYLIHHCRYLDCRKRWGNQAYASIHFSREMMNLPEGHYCFFDPPGRGERLFRIPSKDILDKCFPAWSPRNEIVLSVPWEYPTDGKIPFEKYEIPVMASVEL